jgi:hypothetical protein
MAGMIAMGLIAAPAAKAPEVVEKPAIAVFDLEPINGVSAGLAKLLTESLLTRLNRSRRFASVIGGSDIRAMLDMEQQKQVLGCDDESCLAELGGALGVPLMINPTLGLIGERFIINLKVLAVEEARVKARTEGVFGSEGDLLSGLPGLVDDLLAELAGDLPAVAEPPKKRTPLVTKIGMGVSLTGALAVVYGFYAAKMAADALPADGRVEIADIETYEVALSLADTSAVIGWSMIGVGVAMRWLAP